MNINLYISEDMDSILTHAFIQNLCEGKYSLKELRIFAEQYYLVSCAFVEFLLLGSIRIKKDSDRCVFIENLFDEHGRGSKKDNHRELLEKFLLAAECKPVGEIKPLVKTSAYIHGMRDLCRTGTQLEVLGAIGPGCEEYLVKLYTLINNAIIHHFTFEKRELVFFATHIAHDPSHTSDIEDVIKSLAMNDSDYSQIISGAKQALIFEKILWDGIYEECTRSQ